MKLSMSMFVSALTLVLLVSGQGYGEEDVAQVS